jgi:hypothetical protein
MCTHARTHVYMHMYMCVYILHIDGHNLFSYVGTDILSVQRVLQQPNSNAATLHAIMQLHMQVTYKVLCLETFCKCTIFLSTS